jgi:peptidoglycan/LPS O-acetylase OafA/YrhL
MALLLATLGGRLTGLRELVFVPVFAIGMLAFEIRQRPAWADRLQGPLPAALALLTLVVGMVLFRTPWGRGLPLFAVTFTCIACGNSLFGLLASKGARVLGEASYGIYLVHGIVLHLAFTMAPGLAGGQPLLALPLLAVLVTLLTAAGFLLVERPAIALGRRFVPKHVKYG